MTARRSDQTLYKVCDNLHTDRSMSCGVTSISQADSDNMVHHLCYRLLYAPSVYCFFLHLAYMACPNFPLSLFRTTWVHRLKRATLATKITLICKVVQHSKAARPAGKLEVGGGEGGIPIFAAIRRLRQVLPRACKYSGSRCMPFQSLVRGLKHASG
jgi:hypothetical protein